MKQVPVISWVLAGNWKEAFDHGEYSELVVTTAKGEFALTLEGDSMKPEFGEGDIIGMELVRDGGHNLIGEVVEKRKRY